MIESIFQYPSCHLYNEWWLVYGDNVVEELESLDIHYDDIKPLVIGKEFRSSHEENWRIKVTDEESITMLKLMS